MSDIKELKKASDDALAVAQKAIDACDCWPDLCVKCKALADEANRLDSIRSAAAIVDLPPLKWLEGAKVFKTKGRRK